MRPALYCSGFVMAMAALMATGGASPAQDVARTMRIHDCGFLVAGKPDLPGPDLTRFPVFPESEITTSTENQPASVLEPALLVAMIQANIQPDSWKHDKNKIQLAHGKLTVIQTPDVHEKIAQFLATLRQAHQRMIHVVGHALSVQPDHFQAWRTRAAARGTGAILSPDDLAWFLDADADRVTVQGTVWIPAYSGQLVHAGPITRERFIRDVDPEVAEEATGSCPVMSDLLTGLMFQIRPSLVGPGLVLCDVALAHATRDGEMTSVETGCGRIDVPVRRLQSTRTTLLVPRDHAALLAVSTPHPGDRVQVFLVIPRVVQTAAAPGAGERESPTPTRELRVYDTRLLTARIQDRPGSAYVKLDVEIAQVAEVFKTVYGDAAVDEGVGLDPEQLVALIRNSIEEDSWTNTRNSIRMAGDILVVVQKPEVHERIAAFLDALRARRGVLVSTEVLVLAVETSQLGELVTMADLGAPLTPPAIGNLHQAVARGAAKLLQRASLTSFNHQRAHVQSVVERSVIAGVEVEVAKKASTMDPDVQPLRSGFFLDVRPGLVGNGKSVGLDLFAVYSLATEPRAVAWCEAKPYVVHQYAEHTSDLSTSVFLPDGSTLALLRGPAPNAPGHSLVFLVTARVVRVRR
jgi:hypothetical protein